MEQIDRAERYLERIRNVYRGVFSSTHDNDLYEDDLVSFFMHCYHIRDWILHLNNVGITAEQLDAFINSHDALKVCADLCNGSKHCRLTRKPRSGGQPHVASKTYQSATWFTGSGGGEVVKGSYIVLTSSGFIDALELAEQCMQLWKGFVEAIEHTHNKALKPTVPPPLRSDGPTA